MLFIFEHILNNFRILNIEIVAYSWGFKYYKHILTYCILILKTINTYASIHNA